MRRWAGGTAGLLAAVLLGCGTGGGGSGDAGLVDVDAGDTDAADGDAGTQSARLTLSEGPPLPAPDEVLGSGQGLGKNVRDASHDAAGNLWAVDGARIYVRRDGAGAFESFGTADGLSGQELMSVGGGLAGVAWVGYRGQGDDSAGEPIEWRDTGGGARVELDGADVKVKNHLLVSPPGMFSQYPDGRYKLRTCIRAYGVKTGQHAGDAWFGCNHGVALVSRTYGVEEHHHPIKCLWDPVRKRCTEKAGWVGAVAFTPDGDVWIGGGYGVMLLDYTTGPGPGHFWGDEPVHNDSLIEHPLEPNTFGSEDLVGVAVAPDGTLWAASSHSGLVHRHADGSVDLYQASDGLPSNRLTDVAMDSTGGLWVATESAGLFRLEVATGEWRRAPGLPSSLVARVVAEQAGFGERITVTVREAVAVWHGAP